jgi:hypothetical protein
MKKNYTIVFVFITALIALCAFWGCSSSDDDDGNDFGDDGVSKSIKIIDFDDRDGTPPKVKFAIVNAERTVVIAVSDFLPLSNGKNGDAEGEIFIADGENPTGTKWTGTGTYSIFIIQYDEQNKGFPSFLSKEKIKINSALTTRSFNDFREMQDGDWKGE